MSKNQRFLRKAGLCLRLLAGLGITGCAVSKPADSCRIYRLTVTMFPGSEPLALPAECGEDAISPVGNVLYGPRHLTFRIRLPAGEPLQDFCAQLSASGVIVEQMSPAFN